MHAAPADLAFSRETFSKALGDIARFSKCFRNAASIAAGIRGPLGRRTCRVDTNDSILANAEIAKLFANRAGFSNLRHELCTIFHTTHCRAPACTGPYRRDQRSDRKSSPADVFRKPLDVV